MYCSVDDILADVTEQTAIRLTNDSDDQDGINEALLVDKIIEISRYIDTAIKSQYTVPIEDEGDLAFLKPIAVSLVVCSLYQRRFPLEYSDALSERRKQAMADIDKVQKGIIKLTESGTVATRPGYFMVSKRDRMFPDEDLSRY